MSLNHTQAAILASKRLKMDGRSLLTLQSYVGNALNNLARQCANDDYKKRYLMTLPSATTSTITSDSAFRYYSDLSTLMTTPQIMLDYSRNTARYSMFRCYRRFWAMRCRGTG